MNRTEAGIVLDWLREERRLAEACAVVLPKEAGYLAGLSRAIRYLTDEARPVGHFAAQDDIEEGRPA
jgi:hypothetical protein